MDRARNEATGQAPVYGLRGFDHGGGVLMTLMSADGASTLAARIEPLLGDGLRLTRDAGRLPVCHEIRAGEFDRLVAALPVVVLDFVTWSETKPALGCEIYR